MTEEPKPAEKHSESQAKSTPSETAVADSRDRGQLVGRQRADKSYEENPNRPPRLKVSGTFGKQDLSDVHIMKKGDTLQSVVEARLGPNAGAEAVKAFMVETALLSGFKEPAAIQIGHAIQFPPLEQVKSEHPGVFNSMESEQRRSIKNPDGISVTKDRAVDNSIRPPSGAGDQSTGKTEDGSTASLSEFDDLAAEAIEIRKLLQGLKGEAVHPANHKVVAHETSTDIARHVLGPSSPREQIDVYADALCIANNIQDGAHLVAGRSLKMPCINGDGSFTFTNPKVTDETCTMRLGMLEVSDVKSGKYASYCFSGGDGSYSANYTGPTPGDNYNEWFNGKNKGITTERYLDGKKVTTFEDGTIQVIDFRSGLEQTTYADKTASVYDPKDSTRRFHARDGGSTVSLVLRDENGNETVLQTEDYRPDGSKTSKWMHGTVLVEDRVKGTGHQRVPTESGYIEKGWGPSALDDYEETYDSRKHVTVRIVAPGTPDEKTTTSYPDGAITVVSPGRGYRREADGSEHHWGADGGNDFSWSDVQNRLEQSRQNLEHIISERRDVPAAKREKFAADMQSFEKRLQDHHISAREAAESYEQLAKLLTTPENNALVSSEARSLCAIGLMHQLAYPEHTDQGQHNTCNVTTLAERLQTREPSRAAAMVTAAALTGYWTAPDGKLIVIDRNSLRPGTDESEYPPRVDGARSYATQILNLVIANDGTQRRQPAEFYQQRAVDNAIPGDTGERLVDKNGNVLKRIVVGEHSISKNPFDSPDVSDTEIAEIGGRIMGDSHFFLAHEGASKDVDTFDTQQELENHLQRMQDQGTFPAIIQVAGYRYPIVDVDATASGSHVVSITKYDPVHHRVKISNQWGIRMDRWVDAEALFKNTLEL